MTDTLTATAAMIRQSLAHSHANAAKSRTPAEDIRVALATCARDLLRCVEVVNMLPANSSRSEIEEASAFIAFIQEVCRPLDVMLRDVIRTASDNCGGFSPSEQDELATSRIATDAVKDNWLASFQMKAWSANLEPKEYARRYARQIELAGRK